MTYPQTQAPNPAKLPDGPHIRGRLRSIVTHPGISFANTAISQRLQASGFIEPASGDTIAQRKAMLGHAIDMTRPRWQPTALGLEVARYYGWTA